MRPRPLPRPGACPEGGVAAAPRAGPGRSPPPPSPPWPGAPRSPSACASGRSCRTATSASRYHRSRDTPEHGPRERSGRAGSAGVTGTGGGRCPAGAPHHPQRVPRAAGLWPLESGCFPPVSQPWGPSLALWGKAFRSRAGVPGCAGARGSGRAGYPGSDARRGRGLESSDLPVFLLGAGSSSAWRGTAGRGAQMPFHSLWLLSAQLGAARGRPAPQGQRPAAPRCPGIPARFSPAPCPECRTLSPPGLAGGSVPGR